MKQFFGLARTAMIATALTLPVMAQGEGAAPAGSDPAYGRATQPIDDPMRRMTDDDGFDLGWMGLLGLAGLAGLVRRRPAPHTHSDVHSTTTDRIS
jgi:MYXO-CTERM domain-containing protein